MEQNINLLTELPSVSQIYLSAKQIIKVVIGWLILLVIVAALNLLLLPAGNQVANLVTQKNNANIVLTATTKETNELMGKAEKVGAKVVTSEAAKSESAKTAGFSQYLTILAEFTPEGIELDNFKFSSINHDIELTGKALTESLLPEYIDILNNNLNFFNKKFNELSLQKNETNKTVEFTINTQNKQKEEKKE